jgi:hypothetical protein
MNMSKIPIKVNRLLVSGFIIITTLLLSGHLNAATAEAVKAAPFPELIPAQQILINKIEKQPSLERVIVTPAQANQHIQVKINQTINLLPPSSNMEWQISYEPSLLKSLTPPAQMRKPGQEGWLFQPLSAGQSEIMLTSIAPSCESGQICPSTVMQFVYTIKVGDKIPAPKVAAVQNPCDTPMSDAQVATLRAISVKTVKLLHTHRGLLTSEICEMSEAKLKRAINKALHPKPDHPGEAAAFRYLQQQDENGVVPADGLIKAKQHVDMMANLVQPLTGGINRNSWKWIGPGNIGGRIRSILIHPTNPNQMWVGSISGGIWKTTNGGSSWLPVWDFMPNLAITTMIMDPTNSNVMYVGTGEGFFNGDALRGAGVFKSTDGGTSWSQLASTANSNWYYVNRLAISPDGNTLLAATKTGIWRSINGGATWSQQLSGVVVQDIDFDPTDSNKAIAGGRVIVYSIDGGMNWFGTPLSVRAEVAYAPNAPNIVYASIDFNNGEIWKSINGGQNYIKVNTGNSFLGKQGWYDNIIWVDPTNANTVIVGGIDLWRSTDGGASLTKISEWRRMPASPHADHHAIVAHPNFNGTSNKTVFFGNDGGIYKTDDVYTAATTSGWQELNNNLGITQFFGAAGNVSSGVIVGGTQDNGTLRYSGGTETWTQMFGGDGGFSAADPSDPNYFYGEYVYAQIHRSNNGGTSSEYINGQYWNGSSWAWKSPPYMIPDVQNKKANFIAPLILDPNNPNRILIGGESLWKTDDAKTVNTNTTGPSWQSIKGSVGSNISAIAVAKGDSNTIWVGHNNGLVYKSTNGGGSWAQVDTGTPNLPNRYVMRITIDANNHNIVYVTFGGFNSDNIWRTADGGSTWTDITGSGATGLPDAPVRTLVIHPNHPNWLYVGTEVGIFVSEDTGTTWHLPHEGPATVSVDELFWMGNTTRLIAATHGRGLFKTETEKQGPPAAATQVSPTGTITDRTPTYIWNAVSDSTWYYLWVNLGTAKKFAKWYKASDAGCSGGTGQCKVTPSLSLANGDYKWWIQTWNSNGSGPWSSGMNFTMTGAGGPPAAATQVSPKGTIADNTPTYIWNAVSDSTWYYLWVNVGTAKKFAKWYKASDAGCSGGTGQCKVTPSLSLANGDYKWWIQTWNSNGSGPWSSGMSFTVAGAGGPPAAATLVSPKGTIADQTPTYIWNAVSNSTWYYLWVNTGTTKTLAKWYKASDAGCGGGTGQCKVTPSTSLAKGQHSWWIQTWNSNGYGAWSSRMDFNN